MPSFPNFRVRPRIISAQYYLRENPDVAQARIHRQQEKHRGEEDRRDRRVGVQENTQRKMFIMDDAGYSPTGRSGNLAQTRLGPGLPRKYNVCRPSFGLRDGLSARIGRVPLIVRWHAELRSYVPRLPLNGEGAGMTRGSRSKGHAWECIVSHSCGGSLCRRGEIA